MTAIQDIMRQAMTDSCKEFLGGFMEQRKLTVYEGRGKQYAPIPQIVLQGKWLEQIGYNIGDKIVVDCQPEKLPLEKCRQSRRKRIEKSSIPFHN